MDRRRIATKPFSASVLNLEPKRHCQIEVGEELAFCQYPDSGATAVFARLAEIPPNRPRSDPAKLSEYPQYTTDRETFDGSTREV